MTRHGTILRIAARTGLMARACVYLLVGGLAVWAATLGGGDVDRGPAEAFLALETNAPGRILVAALALGLLLYAGWRALQAALDTDNEGRDGRAWLARAGMAASGLSYFLVAAGAIATLLGRNDAGGPDSAETFARTLLSLPLGLGVALLALAALAFAAAGAAQVWRAAKGQFRDKLQDCRITRRLAPVCMVGIAGRGLLFMLLAWFLIYAAEDADPDEAMGMAELMGWLRDQPFGLALYLGVAASLLGYAAYSLIEARYARIGANV